MLVEQVEALKSIQEAYVAMNSDQLDEGFSKPKGFVNITKDEHDAILKKRLVHEKEHGIKNHREVLSKRDTLTNTTSTFVSNGGGQVSHGLPEVVAIQDAKKGTTKYFKQPVGGHVKEDLDEKFAHPNHKKLDANNNGKVDAHDFELLRKKKGIKNFKEFKASAGEYSKDNIDKENKYSDHAMKRRKGIDKAINKLTKEDLDALGLDLNELLESDDTYKKSDGKQPSYVVSVLKNGDLQFTSHLEDGSNFTISHSKNTDGIPFEQPLDLKKVTDLANSQLKSNKKYSAIRSTKGTSSVKDVYLVDTTKTDTIFYI